MTIRTILTAVLIAAATSSAFAQVGRGPDVTAERLGARLDERIADMENALNEMKRIRASLDDGASPMDAMDELGRVHRELVESGPLGAAMARRGELPLGERPFGTRPGGPGERRSPPEIEVSAAEVREFAERHLPEVAAWIDQLSDADAPLARRMVSRIRSRVASLVRTEAEDETLAELQVAELKAEIGVMRSVRDLRNAEPDRADAARTQLRAALGDQFDAHLALRRYEVVRTADKIDALELEIRERESNKSAFLDEKLAEIESKTSRFGRDRSRNRPGRP